MALTKSGSASRSSSRVLSVFFLPSFRFFFPCLAEKKPAWIRTRSRDHHFSEISRDLPSNPSYFERKQTSQLVVPEVFKQRLICSPSSVILSFCRRKQQEIHTEPSLLKLSPKCWTENIIENRIKCWIHVEDKKWAHAQIFYVGRRNSTSEFYP